MSYCRWSSDNFKCDLYCYADVGGGYTTHVAKYRRVADTPIPELPDLLECTSEEYTAAHNAQRDWLAAARLVPIGLPCDGETFNDETLREFLHRVEMLAGCGYNVPDSVIAMIKYEMEDV